MRTAAQWFSEYGESHQNATNKAIHWMAVPLIYATVIGLFWSIPQPQWMAEISWLNWALVALVPAMLFYLATSVPLGLGMMALSALCLWACSALAAAEQSVLGWSVGVFVLMWVFQFVGHHIEGKKPSFFKDVQFLLIGPAWVIGFLFRKLGIQY